MSFIIKDDNVLAKYNEIRDKIKETLTLIFIACLVMMKLILFLLTIRMSETTWKFDNIRVNKKGFHKSKQPIKLDFVNINQIVISDKFKHSDDGFKYFIGYKEDEIVKP